MTTIRQHKPDSGTIMVAAVSSFCAESRGDVRLPGWCPVGRMRRCHVLCDRRKDPVDELALVRSPRELGFLNRGAWPAAGQAGSLSSSPRKTTAQIP